MSGNKKGVNEESVLEKLYIKIRNVAFKLVEGIGGVINSIRLVRFVGRQFGNGNVKFIIYSTTFFSYFLLGTNGAM